jgi:iron complex outermembrane receptor protein
MVFNRVLAVLLFFTYSSVLFAQAPGGQGGKMPAIGRIYGKIIDAGTRQPVEYATVTLLAMGKDSVITGALAQSNGDFSVDKIPFGRFRLRIQFLGYKTFFQNVVITPGSVEQDIGNISIEMDNKVLKEVTINAEKEVVTMSIDKRVYSPDKDLSAKGGTALDVMKNVPGVTVDADGNVALRNSSPTIFIDGRPSTLTLEQIPSDQIDRIEVITNPSAKYDASTSGGILNVYLKKNTRPGYNGLITAGVGTNDRYNLMANLNIKEGKGNLSLSYNLNTARNPSTGYTNRTNISNEVPVSYFNQNSNNLAGRNFQNARVAYDYNLTNRSSITLSHGIMFGSMKMDDKQEFTQRNAAGNILFRGDRHNDQESGWMNHTSQVQFRKSYPRKGQEWTTDVTYNRSNRNNDALFTTSNYDGAGSFVSTDLQKNTGSGNSNMITFQFDYTLPFSDSSKLEFGARSNYESERTLLNVYNMNNASGEYVSDSILSNNYRINDLVNAAYVSYSGMFAGIGYQAGLRFEQTRFSGELVGKNQTFEYFYPDGTKNLAKAFFPSLYFSKKLKDGHEFQLNFSRKIARPDFMQVMPFIMFSDKQNYRIGNPALAPEFINLAEVNYNKIFKTGSILSSVYVKHIENQITPFVYQLASDSSVLVSSFINGNTTWAYGWENNIRRSFFDRKMDVSLNATVFYTSISAFSGTQPIENSGISWNTKAIVSYKFPKQFTLQANGGYEAPRIIAQGKTLEVYSMDLSLGKEIIKTLTMNLTLNDVFNTRRFGTVYETDLFSQDLMRRRDIRFLRLSITWRFGEMDASIFRKKKSGGRDSQGGGMDMDY